MGLLIPSISWKCTAEGQWAKPPEDSVMQSVLLDSTCHVHWGSSRMSFPIGDFWREFDLI